MNNRPGLDKLKFQEISQSVANSDAGLKLAFAQYGNELNESQVYELSIRALNRQWRILKDLPKDKFTAEIALAAVKKNSLALEFIPAEFYSPDLFKEAVNQNGLTLKFVPEKDRSQELSTLAIKQEGRALEFVPTIYHNDEMFMLAVKHNGFALQYIPEDKRTDAMYLAAVKSSGRALQFVPENIRTNKLCLEALKNDAKALMYIDVNQCPEDYLLTAVQQNGFAIKLFPKNRLSEKICLAAVQQNGKVLKILPNTMHAEKIYLAAFKQKFKAIKYFHADVCSPEFYLEIVQINGLALQYIPKEKCTPKTYLAAVEHNGIALQFVPDDQRTPDMIMLAINKNGLVLQFIPAEQQTDGLRLIAVQNNGLALNYIPKEQRTINLCLLAVKQNSLALQFVPDDMKSSIIDLITPESILIDNYSARQYFPPGNTYTNEINHLLSTIKHIVITLKDNLSLDHELKDIFLVYADAAKRAQKTLHTDKEDLELLLNDLAKNNAENVNLVLLGHANETYTALGGLNADQIADTLEKYQYLDRVTLLGCSTAKSKPLDDELKMMQHYSKQTAIDCGLIVISRELKEEDYQIMLNKTKLNAACVIINNNDRYELVYLEKKLENEKVISGIKYSLSQEQLNDLKNVLVQGKGIKFPFPKVASQLNIMRDSKNPIKQEELHKILSVSENVTQFSKEHPNYKNDKAMYPFLRSMKIREEEAEHKLLKSLLAHVVTAIKMAIKEKRIDRNVTVKGYTKAIHVDTKERRMHVTRTHLYPGSYRSSTFFSRQDNINRDKLSTERKQTIAAMKDSASATETTVKAIKVKMKPLKKG